MGFRTTIILNNDHLELLRTDPGVGNRIYDAACGFGFSNDGDFGNLGQVVEQHHADVVVLGILGAKGTMSFKELSYTYWRDTNPELTLLKEAADKLGYRLIKKSTKRQKHV